ncbi:MAG: adenylosuccinate lyase [Bdellovibrionales bacterium CG12_big_fil_rev_8_21_14_0_65_38_15]|nr:MAG: adenylosuccinate lyase [Bdellovibrionales bacterium CG22_combo_CG10-13_8_21_14_all_38_13]PIQ57123.1 MAG: adenylosuccinate lyase [Bdellovibrionales bacterium CG12_big_fil_rev_8_21_14_0_65_38_15]PIR30153.1 MAG: adenylosuccinate lyase [Bdellovibrionales bacterium CG11_big_fil_rev_8_21_14_0_20_38_13]
MISRYDIKEVSDLWSEHARYESFLEVELALLQAWEEQADFVPKGTAAKIKEIAKVNTERVDEIEKITRHDVIAFCTMISEQVPVELGRWFHYGVTSSDIIDTAMNLQIKRSLKLVEKELKQVQLELASRAKELKNLTTLGRSHGMMAEPMSFGQKLLGHYCEFARRAQDLKRYIENELTAQTSGAVGNYAILNPKIETRVAELLDLKVEPVSTQIIPRDRVANLIHLGAQIGNAIERLSIEIRHLHRSEVGEVHEGFSKGQKGSSTMPHKKNPVSAENLSGMARYLRSHVTLADENTLLWHERDISHSSAERMMLPDHLGILVYSLRRLSTTVRDLVVHEDVVTDRVKMVDGYLSSFYLHHLLSHSDETREDIYAKVQAAAFEAKEVGQFKAILQEKVSIKLPETPKNLGLAHTQEVFERVFAEYPL